MPCRRSKELGAMYVEAAIVLPVLLLVTFASIFFFMCAARYFSLQMLANDIARDIALGLQAPGDEATGCSVFRRNEKLITGSAQEMNLTTIPNQRFNNTPNGSWSQCARTRYLLNTTLPTTVTATTHPVRAWYDSNLVTSYNVASPGDFVEVTVNYPLKWVLGEGVAMLGIVPNMYLVGKGVSIVEPPRT